MLYLKYKKIIVITIISVVAVVSISSILFFNPFKDDIRIFRGSLVSLVSKSQELTSTYQDEVGKWNRNIYDNMTMVSITDTYLSKFEELQNDAKNLKVPNGYENISNAFIKSLESESTSYKHFKNYLISGNKTEDQIRLNYFSLAYQYEKVYADFLAKKP